MAKKVKLSPEQRRFCQLVAENELKHPAEQVARGKLYTEAGYNSNTPTQHAAEAVRKDHIKKEIARCKRRLQGLSDAEPDLTAHDEAEQNLKAWSTKSSQGANNYALYLLKKKEVGMIESVVDRVLLSPFLSEAELDELSQDVPQDVVVATLAGRPEAPTNAETPINIEETQ